MKGPIIHLEIWELQVTLIIIWSKLTVPFYTSIAITFIKQNLLIYFYYKTMGMLQDSKKIFFVPNWFLLACKMPHMKIWM